MIVPRPALQGRALAAATAALLLGVFAVGSEALVISPLLEDIAADFGTGVDAAGLTVSVYGLAVAVVAPAAGWVADRVSRRGAILWGLVAERNDRTLDEYRELLAAGGGPQVSRPTLCRTLRRLGLRRKKRRCAPASGIGPISRRSARSSASGCGSSTPRTWSFLTRPASPQR